MKSCLGEEEEEAGTLVHFLKIWIERMLPHDAADSSEQLVL